LNFYALALASDFQGDVLSDDGAEVDDHVGDRFRLKAVGADNDFVCSRNEWRELVRAVGIGSGGAGDAGA
jgi:hypothetical protein